MSDNIAHLGVLFILPRELRDEIYGHICCEGSPCLVKNDGWIRSNRRKWQGLGLSMLQVSKAIREEFRAVLFSKKIFAMNHPLIRPEIQRSDIPFIDDISNVKILLDLHVLFHEFVVYPQEIPSLSNKRRLSTVRVEPLSYLTGTSIMRKTCTIDIFNCRPATLSLLLSSPVMHTLSQLTGFMTVQLVFFCGMNVWSYLEVEPYLRQTAPYLEQTSLRISSALESTLGSFTLSEKVFACDESGHWGGRWRQSVTFHPRGHLTKKTDRLEATSIAQVEQATSTSCFNKWITEEHRDIVG